MYINIYLFYGRFSLYSNNYYSTLKYFKDTEVNLQNILIIVSDFNIRDNSWNLLYSFYLIYSNILLEIVDSFNLCLSSNN